MSSGPADAEPAGTSTGHAARFGTRGAPAGGSLARRPPARPGEPVQSRVLFPRPPAGLAGTGAEAMDALARNKISLLVAATDILATLVSGVGVVTRLTDTAARQAGAVDGPDVADVLDALGAWVHAADAFTASESPLGVALAVMPECTDDLYRAVGRSSTSPPPPRALQGRPQ